MAACLPTVQPLTLSSSLSTARPQTITNTLSPPIQPHHGLNYTPPGVHSRQYMKLPPIDTPLSVGEPSWLCSIHPLPTTQLSEHNEWHCITHTHPPWLPCHFCIQYIPLVVLAWLQMLVTLIHTCMGSDPSQEIWESNLRHHSHHMLRMECTHSFPCQSTAFQAWVPTLWSCCLICSTRRSHLTLVWRGEWLHACPHCSHSLSQAL